MHYWFWKPVVCWRGAGDPSERQFVWIVGSLRGFAASCRLTEAQVIQQLRQAAYLPLLEGELGRIVSTT